MSEPNPPSGMTPTDDETDDPAPASVRPTEETLVVSIGARLSTAVHAVGDQLATLRTLRHSAVTLAASQAAAASASGGAVVRVIRSTAQQVAERARLDMLRGIRCDVCASPGIGGAVIRLGASGASRATIQQVRRATDVLAEAWVAEQRAGRPQRWVQPMMVGGGASASRP